MNESLKSALKRNNRTDILVEILRDKGASDEVLKDAKDASRVTGALIDRTFAALPSGTETTEACDEACDETTEACDETTEACEQLTVANIKELVATGKKKNIKAAKAAFKEQFEKDHPNYTELKKLFKKES